MKNFLCLTLTFIVAGCSFFHDAVPSGRSRIETMGRTTPRPGAAVQEEADTLSHLYLCAVEYPDGYDWVKDTAHTTVDARLLVFKDGECIHVLPAGDRFRISTDPDTHFMLGGDLYTAFSDGSRTWVLRNGEEVFSADEAEDVVGMLRLDGMLWTLAQKRRGEGFTLRCDGVPVRESRQGVLTGSLYLDEGDLCFAYGTTVQSAHYTIHKYYLEAGGKTREVSVPYDALSVFDIRRHKGITYATYRQSSTPQDAVLSTDGGTRLLQMGGIQSREARWFEILPAGESVLIKGYFQSANDLRIYALWQPDGQKTTYASHISIHDFYYGDGQVYAIGYDSRMGESVIYTPPSGVAKKPLGARYRFISRRAGTVFGGRFYAALTGDGENLLWLDGEKKKLPLNGPVTVVAYQ